MARRSGYRPESVREFRARRELRAIESAMVAEAASPVAPAPRGRALVAAELAALLTLGALVGTLALHAAHADGADAACCASAPAAARVVADGE